MALSFVWVLFSVSFLCLPVDFFLFLGVKTEVSFVADTGVNRLSSILFAAVCCRGSISYGLDHPRPLSILFQTSMKIDFDDVLKTETIETNAVCCCHQ